MKSETSYRQLDYQDRQTLAISLEQGLSMRVFAKTLNR
jgi:IS30 family transposase